MGAVVPFAFEDHLFRAIDLKGELWFIAGDVAKILGHREAETLTRSLDKDEKDRHTMPTPGGAQEVAIISEPGLYRAIIQRRSTDKLAPAVRDLVVRFQRWVFHDLLPTLRRSGRYVVPGVELHHDTEYRRRLDTVSEARRLFGVGRARLLYERLGLPEVPELPRDPRAEPLAVALEALARAEGTWTGTPSALYVKLGETADPECLGHPRWPRDAQAIGIAVRRLAPILAQRGVRITRRHSGTTQITVALANA